jgi:hypothetical protein
MVLSHPYFVSTMDTAVEDENLRLVSGVAIAERNTSFTVWNSRGS